MASRGEIVLRCNFLGGNAIILRHNSELLYLPVQSARARVQTGRPAGARALTAGRRERVPTRQLARQQPTTTVRIKHTGRPPRPPGWCLSEGYRPYRAVWLGYDPPPVCGASGHSACAYDPSRWSVSWQPVRSPRCCLCSSCCLF